MSRSVSRPQCIFDRVRLRRERFESIDERAEQRSVKHAVQVDLLGFRVLPFKVVDPGVELAQPVETCAAVVPVLGAEQPWNERWEGEREKGCTKSFMRHGLYSKLK